MGKKEEKKKGQGNMVKLKIIYRNFAKALVRNKWPCCHGVWGLFSGHCLSNSTFQTKNKNYV